MDNIYKMFGTDWASNIIYADKTKLQSKIKIIIKLEYLIQSIKTQKSFFSNPVKWKDQNDGIFMRVPLRISNNQYNQSYKNEYFAQCWCHKESESIAMWDLYAKDPNQYVMIESSIDKVMESLWDKKSDRSPVTTYAGEVQYRPLNKLLNPDFFNRELGGMNGVFYPPSGGLAKTLLFKSDSYDHETEFRFIHREDECEELDGFFVSHHTPFAGIINNILLHPEASNEWKTEVEKSLDDSIEFRNFLVLKSELYKLTPEYYTLT